MSDTMTTPAPLTADERNRLAELRNDSNPDPNVQAERDALMARENVPETGPNQAQPLTGEERARLSQLRNRVGAPDMTSDELSEMQALAMREYANAPAPVEARPAADLYARLAAGINEPPPAAPPLPEVAQPQHAMFANLFAAIDHMLGGFGHLVATVPQAAGLAPVISAATQRLQAARSAFMDAMAAYGDVKKGNWRNAAEDAEQAVEDGAAAVESSATWSGTHASAGTVNNGGNVGSAGSTG